MQFQAAGDPQHRRGLGDEIQGVPGPRCAKTSVGLLRTCRAQSRRPGRPQHRQADDLWRGVSAPLPASAGRTGMKPVVVRNIKRADANAAGALEGFGVSTTHEAYGRIGLMKPYMRPIWPNASIAGPAVTVLAQPGDNWMIHVAVEQCQKGDILVVGCTTDNTDGMFGDLLRTSLLAR